MRSEIKYIPSIIVNNSITIIWEGAGRTMESSNPNFDAAKRAIKEKNYDQLLKLFEPAVAIVEKSEGKLTVKNGAVYYGDEQIHNVVVDRILQFMKEDLPFEPLLKFLAKLLENPSKHSVEQLYRFLEHQHLPITDEGNFLGYKSVRGNYKDHHSGTFDNSVGNTVEVPRRNVDDNPDVACSTGLHVGAYEYARDFCRHSGHGQKLVIVEVNPADVVSVPTDSNNQKLRTCKYKVVEDCKGTLDKSLYKSRI